jgi:aminopeptidase N
MWTRCRLALAAIGCVAMMQAAGAVVPQRGVAQTLARERAVQIGELHYAMSVAVDAAADVLQGSLTVGFVLESPREVALDYRPQAEGGARRWRVNGREVAPAMVNEHVMLDAAWLRRGNNEVSVEFHAPIAASGRALTRYEDATDGARYVYSLFVPADASSVFPCFDQPDLKARWTLALSLPRGWQAVGNAALVRSIEEGEMVRHEFARTRPLPTYLFAFAAGPFVALEEAGQDGGTRLLVRKSQVARGEREAAELLGLSRLSNQFFARYFDHPLPFDKHDLVLLPEFPYGGMEHAGAVFLREDAMLFRAPPSAADRLRRANTVLHENAHQWFGNLVTMRWFDDLWLKEGFANFAAAKATEALLPEFDAWNALRAAKLAAYRTDVTQGTTAIWQPIGNLADAKSAYGAIVYTKAPAVLRQAEFYLGQEVFERAVRQVVREHAYGNAEWQDLVAAFERQSGRKLGAWADAWVKRRGMATVRLARPVTAGAAALVTQHDTLNDGGLWPMRVRYAFVGGDGAQNTREVLLDGPGATLEMPPGAAAIIVPNAGDFGYARFLLDADSVRAALSGAERIADRLTRALVYDAVWEEVRDARLAPVDYLRFAARTLPLERDAITYAGLLSRLAFAFRTWLSDAQRDAMAGVVEAALLERMRAAPTTGERLQAMRTLADCAWSAAGLTLLTELLDGGRRVGDAPLAPRDRFTMVERLLVRGHAQGASRLAAETARASGEDTRSFAYAAGAAQRDAAIKARYFGQFLNDSSLAEDWIERALAPLNAVEHAGLTAPLFTQALEALPVLKRRHKIFFVSGWLSAVLGGQESVAALVAVKGFAARPDLDPDLRLKVLEFSDGLERAVRIRARYAD